MYFITSAYIWNTVVWSCTIQRGEGRANTVECQSEGTWKNRRQEEESRRKEWVYT